MKGMAADRIVKYYNELELDTLPSPSVNELKLNTLHCNGNYCTWSYSSIG